MATNLVGQSEDPNVAGVLGEGEEGASGTGVYGRDRSSKGNGVIGYSEHGRGVWGHSKTGYGLLGESENGRGVVGSSQTDYGIRGHSTKSAGIRGSSVEGRGVEGWATQSEGVVGISTSGTGVRGETPGNGVGVLGTSASGVGVFAVSGTYEAVHAETKSSETAAIAAYNLNPNGTGAAIFAKKEGSRGHAGFFVGDVFVTGKMEVATDISCPNSDCAEDFDISPLREVDAGTVMVLGPAGPLFESQSAYDHRVAGVISGAGQYKPGLVLDRHPSRANRQPVALMGKVFCKVDAQFGAVAVGDLLTSSPTPGHAMKTTDPLKAFGAVIGKALEPLPSGQGLIPILVTRQ